MKKRVLFLIASLLLLLAGVQTAWAQGFRVYNSDGTMLQFSLRTDSIVFYDGIGSEQDLGLYTPVNQMIVGTWSNSASQSVTFKEDGTTDYNGYGDEWIGGNYEFFPFQGNLVIYSTTRERCLLLHVVKLTNDSIIMGGIGASDVCCVYTRTKPVQLVTGITLSETFITLQPDEMRRLTATIIPSDADNPVVTWNSSNSAVAEVNQNGRVIANSNGTCTITCFATDGSGVKAECRVRVKNADTVDYIDLGLPSGTLWATCNVGANSPEEYGDYFAWGETEPKSDYSVETYKYCEGTPNTITKYCSKSVFGYNGFSDTLTELQPEDDAATVNWGNEWQMPSTKQLQELYSSSYTTTEWTTQNGVNGRKITSKSNGNSIFLPAAGYRDDTGLYYAGSNGNYWSRSLYSSSPSDANILLFQSSGIYWSFNSRYCGRSVRPVRRQ